MFVSVFCISFVGKVSYQLRTLISDALLILRLDIVEWYRNLKKKFLKHTNGKEQKEKKEFFLKFQNSLFNYLKEN